MKKKILVVVACLLLVVSIVAMVACTPSKESVEKKFTDNNYTVTGLSADEVLSNTVVSALLGLLGADVSALEDSKEGIDYIVIGSQGVVKSAVVISFKNSADAKEFYTSILGDKESSEMCVKKGNAVVLGYSDTVALF